MEHYVKVWKNREVYWQARLRSSHERDMLTTIVDSYDKSKLLIPRYAWNRTPKRPVYEATKRDLPD